MKILLSSPESEARLVLTDETDHNTLLSSEEVGLEIYDKDNKIDARVVVLVPELRAAMIAFGNRFEMRRDVT